MTPLEICDRIECSIKDLDPAIRNEGWDWALVGTNMRISKARYLSYASPENLSILIARLRELEAKHGD